VPVRRRGIGEPLATVAGTVRRRAKAPRRHASGALRSLAGTVGRGDATLAPRGVSRGRRGLAAGTRLTAMACSDQAVTTTEGEQLARIRRAGGRPSAGFRSEVTLRRVAQAGTVRAGRDGGHVLYPRIASPNSWAGSSGWPCGSTGRPGRPSKTAFPASRSPNDARHHKGLAPSPRGPDAVPPFGSPAGQVRFSVQGDRPLDRRPGRRAGSRCACRSACPCATCRRCPCRGRRWCGSPTYGYKPVLLG
jgi:hypothetical protein